MDADDRLEALRAGDRAILSATLAELAPDVRRWTFRLLGPVPHLDDAMQDVLIALAGALPRHEGRSSLRTLAYRITVRVVYRHLKKQRALREREAPLELLPPPADRIDPESQVLHREALKRLYRCLDRMPERRRVAFVLCAIEGMTPGEAAAIEGVSGVTMRARLWHARREIGRRLAKDPYVERLIERWRAE